MVVPAHLCRSEMLLPLRVENNQLVIAMGDPGDLDTIDRISKIVRMRVKPVLAARARSTSELDRVFPAVQVDTSVDKLAGQAARIAPAGIDTSDPTVIAAQVEARPGGRDCGQDSQRGDAHPHQRHSHRADARPYRGALPHRRPAAPRLRASVETASGRRRPHQDHGRRWTSSSTACPRTATLRSPTRTATSTSASRRSRATTAKGL